MLDRASPGTSRSGTARSADPRWPFFSMAFAGLMGGTGVCIAAAGAHVGGGDLAHTSSDFLLIHAAVVIAGSAAAFRPQRWSVLLPAALALMTVGTVLFSGDLALAGLVGWRPWPPAAPIGGLCLIAGWVALSVSALQSGVQR